MREMIRMPFERTKKGFTAIWESGGGATNTGASRIIAGPNGEALRPIYVRQKGPLSQGDHALFIVWPGCHVIVATRHRGEFDIFVYRIEAVDKDEDELLLVKEYEYTRGEWDKEPPEELAAAIAAAKEKAACYHCREPHYYDPDP
jgi:hypothetical protein